MSKPRSNQRSTACTHDSPSFSERTVMPSAANWRRSSTLLTTLPLWAPTRSPSESRWGWALTVEGVPKVAQRSWVMPRVPVISAKPRRLADLVDLALVLAQVHRVVGVEGGAPHRVVAAVGQPPRRVREHRAELLLTVGDDPEDPAHAFLPGAATPNPNDTIPRRQAS